MNKPIEITVGGAGLYDPVAGATDCNIPIIAGQDLWISKQGYGPYDYALYTVISTGGFRLIGSTFEDGEKWFVFAIGTSYQLQYSSNYTNGFNYPQVISALFGRVGWLQSAGSPVLNTNNLFSKSGRYFNDGSFHSLVTLSNLKQVMELNGATDFEFNAYLEALQRGVILRLLSATFGVPEFISQDMTYTRFDSSDKQIQNTGAFTGIRIFRPSSLNYAIQIDKVELYFNEAKTFMLYLYEDTNPTPIWSTSVTSVANARTTVSIPDLVLNNTNGRILYLGYNQDELGTCKAISETDIETIGNRMYGIEFFKCIPGNFSEVNYTGDTTGLNAQLTVFKDHTASITTKAGLFDNAIGLQMAAQVVEQILFTKRSNSDERILGDTAGQMLGSMALDGVAPITDGPQSYGLRKQISAELIRMRESFFPKPNKGTIRNVC
jgi:hypothetical protein